MCYKTIVVFIPNAEAARELMPVATRVARKFMAHLIGICPKELPHIPPSVDMYIDADTRNRFWQESTKSADAAKVVFEAATQAEDFTCEWLEGTSSSAKVTPEVMGVALRSDLIIASANDWNVSIKKDATVLHDLILGTGRPVLMVPTGCECNTLGNEILLCWTPTKEACAAAFNAIGFMKAAHNTTIMTVNVTGQKNAEEEFEGHEMAKVLARHGVKTKIWHVNKGAESIGEKILSEAKISGVDLIVMGAYGHSRVHDFFFSDATRHVIEQARTPIFFSA